MNQIKVITFLEIFASISLAIIGIVLIITATSTSLPPELVEASNFDESSTLILIAGIVAIIYSIASLYAFAKLNSIKNKNGMTGELLYILGLGKYIEIYTFLTCYKIAAIKCYTAWGLLSCMIYVFIQSYHIFTKMCKRIISFLIMFLISVPIILYEHHLSISLNPSFYSIKAYS